MQQLQDNYFQKLLDYCDVELADHNVRMFIAGALIGIEPCNSISIFQTLINPSRSALIDQVLFEVFLEFYNREDENLNSGEIPTLLRPSQIANLSEDKNRFAVSKLSEIAFFYGGLRESKGM